jgi:hypothetical protein
MVRTNCMKKFPKIYEHACVMNVRMHKYTSRSSCILMDLYAWFCDYGFKDGFFFIGSQM